MNKDLKMQQNILTRGGEGICELTFTKQTSSISAQQKETVISAELCR